MTCRGPGIVALLVSFSGACLGTTPEERAARAIDCPPSPFEDEDEDEGDEEHCAGEPCLTCHSEDYHPGDRVFAVAGTVYLRASDSLGVVGAEVTMTDSAGHQFTARTNRVGNFMVRVREGLAEPRRRDEGRLDIPWQPVFPLRVEISHTAGQTKMETRIWREGSCAGCHYDPPGAESVGKIFILEEGQ